MTRDRWAYGLMAVVAVAAAWISFSALTGLARLAHIWPPQLLPLAIDAYAVAATRIWLTGTGTARTWAMLNSFGAIAISIAGNAAYHGLAAAGVTRLPWELAAAVAAVAPLMLWLVVHLHSLLATREHTPEVVPAPVPPAIPPAKPTPRKPRPREQGKSAAARGWITTEVAAGRRPTGAEVARKFVIDDSLARRLVRDLAPASNGHGHG